MRIFVTILILILQNSCFGQSSIDSLILEHQNLSSDSSNNSQEIEAIESEIVDQILLYGFSTELNSEYNNQTFDLMDSSPYGRVIATISNGETVKIIGEENFLLKVEYKDQVGYIYLFNPDFPLSLLTEKKHSSEIPQSSNVSDKRISKIKQNNSNCQSSQCTGLTQKGNRCKNVTTNCSGRCHLH